MREARAIMGDLATSGLSPQQQALLMELTAALAAEARPVVDQAAENKRAYDREYRRKNRTTSYESRDANDPPPKEYISNPPPLEKPTSSDVVKKPKRARSFEFEVPAWVPAEPWEAFAEMRRRKKKPLDDYTAKQLFGRLETIRAAGWNIEDVIAKATIAQHDGFWMPDGRDSNIRRSTPGTAKRPMTKDELRRAIAFAEDNQDHERAAELKRQLSATGPPADPKVAQLVRSVGNQLRATG